MSARDAVLHTLCTMRRFYLPRGKNGSKYFGASLPPPFSKPSSHNLEFVANGEHVVWKDKGLLLKALRERPSLRSVKVFRAESLLLSKAVVEQLQHLPNLEELYLAANAGAAKLDFPPSHLFPNLQSLSVHETPPEDHTYISHLPELLRGLPGLRHLGLSWRVGLEHDAQDQLYHLASQFRSHRLRGWNAPDQREIKSLAEGDYPAIDNYLNEITVVSYLESLRLDNAQIMHPCPEDMLFYSGWDAPYNHILPEMFRCARNLQSLTVERLSPDIVQLVRLVKDAQGSAPGGLDTLRVLKYCSTLKTEHSEFDQDDYEWGLGEPGELIYSVPLDEAGYDWRRLCYSGFPVSHQTTECLSMATQLLQFVSRCSGLEELAIPFTVLHLPWSEVADFMGSRHPEEPVDYWGRRSRDLSEEETHYFTRKDEAYNRKPNREKILVVRELFEWHHYLRTQQPDMAPLQYIAIDEDAFIRLSRSEVEKIRNETESSDDSDLYVLSDGSRIVQLEKEEARKIGIINILYHYRLARMKNKAPV
ncbi:hypothetical protein BJX62DRAFT_240642 [Aspergillus germanicus]